MSAGQYAIKSYKVAVSTANDANKTTPNTKAQSIAKTLPGERKSVFFLKPKKRRINKIKKQIIEMISI